ncbi:hypothetical protein CDO52_14800 [Nocardiopsis gilva YIM 90087]|uniref:Ribosomal subunit interface protein n=1 Tax=Nocardiopsis gilva YIM 90087 TaxID=1235441 RepID=A0A223S6Y6_9ACTN|nr:hypothetical protein [Nocardiopsis gilva]ASU83881.1 hypothetical protein CDO52_14800 [Nocardiopsis gilva YIM 90087]
MKRTEAWRDQRATVSLARGFDVMVIAHLKDRLTALDRRFCPSIRHTYADVRHVAAPGYGKLTRVELVIELGVGVATGSVHAVADADSVCVAVDKVLRRAVRLLVARHGAEAHEQARWVPPNGPRPTASEPADGDSSGPATV